MSARSDALASPPVHTTAWRRFGPTLVRIGLTVTILGFLASRTDLARAAVITRAADPWLVSLAVVVLFGSYAVGGLRWWCVTRALGQSTSLGALVGLFWIGGLASQALPSPLGDAVRVAAATRQGVSLTGAATSTIIERTVMLLVLMLLVCVTSGFPGAVGRTDFQFIAVLVSLAGAGAFLATGWIGPVVASRPGLPFAPAAVALSTAVRRWVVSEWATATIGMAVLGNLNIVVAAMILGTGFHLPLQPIDYVGVMPVAMLAMVIPISVGGWGVREGALVALMGRLSVPAATALCCTLFSSDRALGFVPAFLCVSHFAMKFRLS